MSLSFSNLGYLLPYADRTTFVSLPYELQRKILALCFPSSDRSDQIAHYCTSDFPCIIAKPLIRLAAPIYLVCKRWRDLVAGVLQTTLHYILPQVVDKSLEGVYPSYRTEDIDECCWRYEKYGSVESCSKLDYVCVVAGRFRIKTLMVWDRGHDLGLFRALDYSAGCARPQDVVLKVFTKNYKPHYYESEEKAWKMLYDKQVAGIPRCLQWFRGEDYQKRPYIAMTCLGPDLQKFYEIYGNPFPLRLLLAVGIQLLHRYEALHECEIMHNGCKPANICLPPEPDTLSVYGFSSPAVARSADCLLYLIDFDMSKPKSTRWQGWFGGNSYYASVWFHCDSIAASQRDDLEALGHLLVYLANGKLPWNGSNPEDCVSTPLTQTCAGMDPVFLQYMREVRVLAHGEAPDYAGLRAQFANVWMEREYGGVPGNVDWWGLYKEAVQAKERKEREAEDQECREEAEEGLKKVRE